MFIILLKFNIIMPKSNKSNIETRIILFCFPSLNNSKTKIMENKIIVIYPVLVPIKTTHKQLAAKVTIDFIFPTFSNFQNKYITKLDKINEISFVA